MPGQGSVYSWTIRRETQTNLWSACASGSSNSPVTKDWMLRSTLKRVTLCLDLQAKAIKQEQVVEMSLKCHSWNLPAEESDNIITRLRSTKGSDIRHQPASSHFLGGMKIRDQRGLQVFTSFHFNSKIKRMVNSALSLLDEVDGATPASWMVDWAN